MKDPPMMYVFIFLDRPDCHLVRTEKNGEPVFTYTYKRNPTFVVITQCLN